jgi:hypothetical protein
MIQIILMTLKVINMIQIYTKYTLRKMFNQPVNEDKIAKEQSFNRKMIDFGYVQRNHN